MAIATGGWLGSAELKLEYAGFDWNAIPIATSSDCLTREGIMQIAETRAKSQGSISKFLTKIYVGDAVWDVKASKSLGYEFIGVGQTTHTVQLKNAGAERVIKDYESVSPFYDYLTNGLNT